MAKATACTTQYGFKYGPIEVSRIHADDKGNVWIEIRSERDVLNVRATPTGLIRKWKG